MMTLPEALSALALEQRKVAILIDAVDVHWYSLSEEIPVVVRNRGQKTLYTTSSVGYAGILEAQLWINQYRIDALLKIWSLT